jgi:Na+/H+-dicarboxylate symporter
MKDGGGKLARYTIYWYVGTTIIAIVISTILVDLVWRPLMTVADAETIAVSEEQQADIDERGGMAPHDVVVQVFESFIPNNVASALANDELLAVLVSAIVVGCLIKGPDSSILRAVREIEKIVMWIITFLIKLAPVGVFFLILSNLFTLNIEDIGQNLGVLVGASIVNMAIHMFIVFPILYFIFMRENFYTFWFKCSRSWITAWATASSAATMPVTLQVAAERKIPHMVANFTIPLGTLVNMDGTAIYFPTVVVFLAATQGMPLNAGDYAIIVLLATLSSIATTPIPSSSLVLTLIIAESVSIPITGMYAVVVAIDWFIDRFRTLVNVSGDLLASKIMAKLTGITDEDSADFEPNEQAQRVMSNAGVVQQQNQHMPHNQTKEMA